MSTTMIYGEVLKIEKVKKPKGFSVAISEDHVVLLKKSHPHFKTVKKAVRASYQYRFPIFASITEDNELKTVYCPAETVVEDISPLIWKKGSQAYEVKLRYSQARHYAYPDHSNHRATMAVLRDSLANKTPVLVADCYFSPQIVGAVPLDPDEGRYQDLTFDRDESDFELITEWFAEKLFQKLKNGESCDAQDMSFDFVEDGCVWRAHEMCRQILEEGVSPIKLWLFRNLDPIQPATSNHPNCKARWGFHVAPAVNTKGGLRVIDPSLFDIPVTVNVWRERMNSCSAKLLYTGHHVSYISDVGTAFLADREYKQTWKELRRIKLNFAQFVAANGSPPYKKCRLASH